MRIIIQRVCEASVEVENKLVSSIQKGMLVLLAVEELDTFEDINWLCGKIAKLRVFNDTDGLMNLSVLDVKDINGEILVVSQFTLFASTKKGNRPSFTRSAKPEFAEKMYLSFVLELEKLLSKKVPTGVFGANMKVRLVNDGPVTIVIDSKIREEY